MAKPGRFIQTTLLYEDKAASFVFVEGLDEVALAELDTHGLIRPVPFARIYARTSTGAPGGVLLSPSENAVSLAAELIDNPFPNDLRPDAHVKISDIPGSHKWQQWTGALLQSDSVIVCQSPPEQLSLQSLAKLASSVAMGAWVGTQAASALGQPILMFLTVPAGMLIISAASGISKALENGLYDWLSRKRFSRRAATSSTAASIETAKSLVQGKSQTLILPHNSLDARLNGC